MKKLRAILRLIEPGVPAASLKVIQRDMRAKKLNLPLRLVHCAQDWVVTGDLPLVMPDDQLFRDQRCPKLCSKNQDGAAACRACAAYDGSANWVRIGGCEPLSHALCEL